MPRPSNSAQRRQEIATAFLQIMAGHGYAGATIARVARQAGLAPGLVHYHFANKQAILLAALAQLEALGDARYQPLLAAARDPRERLAALIHARLARGEGAAPEAVAAWVMIGAEAVRAEEVRAAYQATLAREQARLESLLADYGAARGRPLTPARAQALAAMVMAAVEGSSSFPLRPGKSCPGTMPPPPCSPWWSATWMASLPRRRTVHDG